ncbi:hypothetical protein [Candidatus Nitrosocosmicus sp. SS]|uniref:hypothetical protein n=1 Tax=Candidatus Nitrosocosmicus agrestis TaxID=2563600 RepID=UPI00122E0F77|nr:hypothetical protein [Candidatus Nitrosocosmicus sp. SS]KAA2280691.1 hypothetical protein F1Z66_10410 [Candidatus Nitrosocosmicus sp. SS]KAF0869325.1 hypothetical protein E5N71_05505 [Candidatus Nitrosocosmicus sp. SS]MDR4492652.1 hypothetical protein [Candidatus Nitrosocosmicus sp.]
MSVSVTIVNILTTKKMGHFFQEFGRSPDNHNLLSPTSQDLLHLSTISKKYGYWNASSEENKWLA